MSMTEQEIRADERKKVAGEIEAASVFDGASKHVCDMLAKYVRAKSAGGWREWKGNHVPAADLRLIVEVECRNGRRRTGTVESHGIWWDQSLNDPRVIVRWRLPVAKPEPKAEPKNTSQWFDYCWGGHHWITTPKKVATPTPKDWRDVPVTAGMLVKACEGIDDDAFNTVADLIEFAALKKTAR